jgi:hypothetical protein
MSDTVDDTLIDTWRPRRWSWLVLVPTAVFVGAWLITSGSWLYRSVREGDSIGSVVFALVFLAGLWCLVLSVRYQTSRLEIRRNGLVVSSLGRRRDVPWTNLARVEVDDVEVTTLRGRGPCVVLVLVGGRRVRLWVTEQSRWSYERRQDAVQQQAELLRSIRRDCQGPTSR